jgi:hypothetical protein
VVSYSGFNSLTEWRLRSVQCINTMSKNLLNMPIADLIFPERSVLSGNKDF